MTKANDSLIAFLPCRKGSQRIKEKNIKPILDFKMGLDELKLSQLLKGEKIKKFFLSTDDIQIINLFQLLFMRMIIIIEIFLRMITNCFFLAVFGQIIF